MKEERAAERAAMQKQQEGHNAFALAAIREVGLTARSMGKSTSNAVGAAVGGKRERECTLGDAGGASGKRRMGEDKEEDRLLQLLMARRERLDERLTREE